MQLYESIKSLRHSHFYSFFIGVFAAVLGIITTWLLFSKTFPDSIGLVSVFFTAFALFPFWSKILSIRSVLVGTEREVRKGKDIYLTELHAVSRKQQLNPLHQLRNHKDMFLAYTVSFLGIFIVYAIFQLLLPPELAENLFNQQTSILGAAASQFSQFDFALALLVNNFFVLVLCFVISLIYRSGIFIIVWNASVWGVIFGQVIRESSALLGQNALLLFFLTIIVVLPHMILEAFAYLSASISGGLTFQVIVKKLSEKHTSMLLIDAALIIVLALIALVLGAIVESYFAAPAIQWVFQ